MPMPFPYPWRYLAESATFTPWFVCHPRPGDTVDIGDFQGLRLFEALPRGLAESMVAAREVFLAQMRDLNTHWGGA